MHKEQAICNWAVVHRNFNCANATTAFARTTEGTFEAPNNANGWYTKWRNEIYVNTYAADDDVLVGYKGTSERAQRSQLFINAKWRCA